MTDKKKARPAYLPAQPGVYQMKDKKGKIIYIGKAKNLKNRVNSYFNSPSRLDPKTAALMAKVADIDLIVTDSEIEALILEANLVKEHKPRYNVNLKDDKRYPYLQLTVNEPFPRLMVTRRVQKDGARYFGPYTNAAGMRRTLQFLMRHFGLRSCNFELPPPPGKKYKVCLDYHIGRCAGACEYLETEKEYQRHVRAVEMFLSGRRTDLIKDTELRMKAASDDMKYEEAARLRDTVTALESVRQRQKVDAAEMADRDIIAFAREENYAAAVVLQIREGTLIGRQDIPLNIEAKISDDELLYGFLSQYYNHAENLPAEIYLPLKINEADLLGQWLSEIRGGRVKVIAPQKGDKVKLIGMAETNARLLLNELLIQKEKYKTRIPAAASELQKYLGLTKAPLTVSCFDISNLGASDKAASLVYFERGKPKKSQYRHFKIKTVSGQDDFASMREVVERYVGRHSDEDMTLPDLMMIDGGKGQLSTAVEVLTQFGFTDQPIIGLAKRLEEVFIPGQSEPVFIPRTSAAINLLKRVRDEAHRFAITYHRKLRSKRTIGSELDQIPGLGPSRRQTLLKHFGSVKKLKEATVEEIAAVKNIPQKLAVLIYDYFHPQSDNH